MEFNQEIDQLCLTFLDEKRINKRSKIIYHEHTAKEIVERLAVLKTKLDILISNSINDEKFYEKIRPFENIQLYLMNVFTGELPTELTEKIYHQFNNNNDDSIGTQLVKIKYLPRKMIKI